MARCPVGGQPVTVGELREALRYYPDDAEVVVIGSRGEMYLSGGHSGSGDEHGQIMQLSEAEASQ